MDRKGVVRIAQNIYFDYASESLFTFDDSWASQSLTRIEADLLAYLIENCNIMLVNDRIYEAVWGFGESGAGDPAAAVRKFIRQVRQKIDSLNTGVKSKYLIETLKGHGKYCLKTDCLRHFDSLDEVFHFIDAPEETASEEVASDESASILMEESAERPARTNDLDREYTRARLFEGNGQISRSFAIHYRLARQGYAPSLNYLGVYYCRGEYVPQNIRLGIEKYREAAKLNYPAALLNMGDYHMNTQLGEYSPTEALRLYHLAAEHPEHPDDDAMYRLYLCYKHGIGTEPDLLESEQWRTLAEERGVSEYNNYYELSPALRKTDPLIAGDTLLALSPKSAYRVLTRKDTGEVICLRKKSLLAGNDPDICSLVLADSADSRHALIRFESDQMIVTDLYSVDGTFINGKRIVPLEEYVLQKWDSISFGSECFITEEKKS